MWLKLFACAVIFLLEVSNGLSKITGSEYQQIPDLFYFDDYEKCSHNSNNPVYCTVMVQLFPENFINASEAWTIIEEISSNKNNYRHDLVRHGICTTRICPKYNETSVPECLNRIYRTKYEHMGLTGKVLDTNCKAKREEYEVKTGELILLAFLGTYVSFVLLISVFLEITKTKNVENNQEVSSIKKFFSIFSFFDNLNYLLNKDSVKIKNYMLFVQGIRVAATIGVVITHATEITLITPVSNPWFIEEIPKRFITMIIANGGMTVQVYFVISSWLLSISFFKELQDSKERNFTYVMRYIARRYIRFTPAYALIIVLHSTWLVHLSHGPFWDPIIGEEYRICRKNWWKNLLYINNFDMDDGLCMFHSWYLSVDFQFTVLGLLILWLTQRKPKLLLVVGGLIITFQAMILFYYLFWNNFEFAVVMTPELLYYFKLIYYKEWQITWTTTYSNLTGLVTGLYLGYIYTKYNKKIFTRKKHTILWWIFSWGLLFATVLFSSYYMTTDFYKKSRWFASIYGSIYKSLYAFGFGLILLGMSQNLGGIVKSCFEWPPMHALGQLSFGAYLVHFTILKVKAGSRKTLPYASDFVMFNEIITNLTESYLCSLILTLFILMPVANLSNKLI